MNLSVSAHRHALRGRLKRIHRKIAKMEQEIAERQGWLLEFSPTEYVLVLGFATNG